jgi:addiction module antidote protein, HigA family
MRRKQITAVHPGEYLRELLEELNLSQYRVAKDIGVAPVRISHVINLQRPITAELALRLGRYFRQSPRFWLNLQARYDMDVTEDQIGAEVAKQIRPFKAVA